MGSTIGTWAQELTNHLTELRKHALSHRAGNSTTQSHEQGTQFKHSLVCRLDFCTSLRDPLGHTERIKQTLRLDGFSY